MSGPFLRLSIQESCATIILNRPEKRNALSRLLLAELSQTFDDLHLERKVRSIILTGAGPAFCSGMDLSEMLATSQAIDANGRWQHDAEHYQALLEKMLRFPKPIIAAVNGPCVAGGVSLVLACDIVVASDQATISLPETRRGIVAGLAAPLLCFRLGAGWAANLLLSGKELSAEEAQRCGLFHELVEAEKVWARAQQIAAQIAELAPTALLMTKKLLNETVGESMSTLLSAAAAASASSRTTEEATEGLKAFLEKRDPVWP